MWERATWLALIELAHGGTDLDWRAARQAVDEARGAALIEEALRWAEGIPERVWVVERPDGQKVRLG
jgi:hypothetical protein